MSIWLLLALAAVITYTSRAATTAVLPAPEGRLGVIIERLPAPLFSALAAVLGALVATRTRSMFLILAAGLASYALAGWLTGF